MTRVALLALALLLFPNREEPLLARLASGPDGYDAALAERLAAEERGVELFTAERLPELAARRARARWFRRHGGPETLDGALAAVRAEADGRARRDLLRGLPSAAASPADRERVAAALDGLARGGSAPRESGEELLAAGSALGGDLGAALLDGWIDAWPAARAREAAKALGALRSGASRVEARLLGAFETPPAERPADPVLAELLVAHGRLWGEDAGGADAPRRRLPIERGLAHPSPLVREAAWTAIERFLFACERLERPRRADRLLADLAAARPDPRPFRARRAVHALTRGMDPGVAAAAARRLADEALPDPDGAWAARAAYYGALAALAADDPAGARAALDRAAAIHDEALARRLDLARDAQGEPMEGARVRHALRLADRAGVELARVLVRLAEGGTAGDLALLERCRRAHALALEAQVAAAAGDGPGLESLDDLLEPDSAPTRLFFARPPHAAWPADRAFALRAELGRALASVAPFELPGFDPVDGLPPALADPERDPERAHWLDEVPRRRRLRLLEELERLEDRMLALRVEGERLDPEQETELAVLRWRLRRDRDAPPMDELRAPSRFALWLADDLRADGRPAPARELARALLADVEAAELDAKTGTGLNLAIEARITIGGTLTDQGRGEEAEEELLRAVERLEGFENLIRERGGDERAERTVRRRRAGALVSLAVNANVKLREPERALAYFERAHELAPEEAGDVLLACYRARMGQDEEARAILADVLEEPGSYYNLACTHALLGDADRALDYLERDFRENHGTPGSLRRQQEWAEGDPDLASLHDDPRFRALVEAPASELLGR